MPAPTLRVGTFVHEVSPGLVQVGSTPEHAVTFTGLAPQETKWIKSLVPAHRLESQRRKTNRCAVLTERQEEILKLMDAVELLAPARDPMEHLRIRVVGLNKVGIRIATLLAEAGVKYLDVRDSQLVDANVEHLFAPEDKGKPRLQALRKQLARSRNIRVGRTTYPDLVITCSDRVWDHGVLGVLLSHDINHLPVVTDDRAIHVGPLIAPGMTACALCVEMHVDAMLPNWPSVALALRNCGQAPVADHMASTAAGLAVTMVEAAALGLNSPVVDTDTESETDTEIDAGMSPRTDGENSTRNPHGLPSQSWRVTQLGVDSVSWYPHPDCRCTGSLVADV